MARRVRPRASRGRKPKKISWDVRGTKIPRAIVDPAVARHTFAFVPDQKREPAGPNDPLTQSVVQLLGFRVGEDVPRTAASAVFIAPDILLTAAHALFDPASDAFGAQRSGYAAGVVVRSAFGPLQNGIPTQRFVAPPGYTAPPGDTASRDPAADLAVIKLPAAVPGVRPLIPVSANDGQVQNQAVWVYGYPELSTQLYLAAGTCVAGAGGLLFHTCDAWDGESGGPLLLNAGGAPELVGIHRAGPGESPPGVPTSCVAVRLVADAVAWINQMGAKL